MDKKIKLITLFGKSGAGKDSLLKAAVAANPQLHPVVSFTTRPLRDYEKHGVDYVFITNEELQRLKECNMILEYTTFNGWTYGTVKDELEPDVINIGVYNLSGIYQLKHSKDIEIYPVYIKTDDKIRLKRCLDREDNPNCAEICRRFKVDEEDFASKNITFDHYVIYNNLDKIPVEKLLNFIKNIG